jgi:CubicO group peptidase (beta-lactamase class C family)
LRYRVYFVALVFGSLFGSSAFPQISTSQVNRMQQVVQNYVDNKSFMGTVLVAEKDKVLLNQGYGYADLEWIYSDKKL